MMSQTEAKSGAVNAYYSWKVQNPSEAIYDAMIEVDAVKGSASVYISWKDRTKRNADELNDSDMSNQTTIVARPLYGAVVGVDDGLSDFTLSYVDSADWTSSVTPSSSTTSVTTSSASARCFRHSYPQLLLATVVMLLRQLPSTVYRLSAFVSVPS